MFYEPKDYDAVIAATPTEWKGRLLKEKSARAICIGRRKNKATNNIMTLYYMDGRYFIVECGKIL